MHCGPAQLLWKPLNIATDLSGDKSTHCPRMWVRGKMRQVASRDPRAVLCCGASRWSPTQQSILHYDQQYYAMLPQTMTFMLQQAGY
jgi:hypothetical protein